MASPGAIAKKHDRQIARIIDTILVLTEATQTLRSEIAELKAKEDERPDRTGEILVAIANSVVEIRDQQDRTLNACSMMAAEISSLKELVRKSATATRKK